MEEEALDSLDVAHRAVDVASDKLASDVVLKDLRGKTTFTDFFVLATVDSDRQMRSLQDDVEQAMEEAGAALHHREGSVEGGWVLLDFADVIIHLFTPTEREFYRLDQVWADAPTLVRVQ